MTTPAGQWLDELVAEKVMGLKMNGAELPIIWEPSRSIRDAWDVMQKLREHRNPEWIPDVSANSITGGWVCSIGCKWTGVIGNIAWINADTAPLAICLAALQAVGRE